MDRLIRLPELTDRLGIGKTKLYDMVKNGQFPKPVKLGNVSVWSSDSVGEWIKDRSDQQRR